MEVKINNHVNDIEKELIQCQKGLHNLSKDMDELKADFYQYRIESKRLAYLLTICVVLNTLMFISLVLFKF